jgi:hypothetical protein
MEFTHFPHLILLPCCQGERRFSMPLSINVGLSRKASKDYQSSGVSINVTAELDQALLARPEELQRQIGDLYLQAESALVTQSNHVDQSQPPPRPNANGNGRSTRGNGQTGRINNGQRMTARQRRAIVSIADRLDIDPDLEARDIIGSELDQMTIRQASDLIDHLKSISPAGNGARIRA